MYTNPGALFIQQLYYYPINSILLKFNVLNCIQKKQWY